MRRPVRNASIHRRVSPLIPYFSVWSVASLLLTVAFASDSSSDLSICGFVFTGPCFEEDERVINLSIFLSV